MNPGTKSIKNILLVEADLRDGKLTLGAPKENQLSNKVAVVHDRVEAESQTHP